MITTMRRLTVRRGHRDHAILNDITGYYILHRLSLDLPHNPAQMAPGVLRIGSERFYEGARVRIAFHEDSL